jgi:hypothetical protein
MPLSDEKIASLMKTPTGSTGELYGGEKHFTANGWAYGKVTTEMKGSFQGKQGTSVRSRKGRTYRKGNGYVNYIEEWWTPNPVVAYKV